MEIFSFIPLTLASVLASFSANTEEVSESAIAIHILPEIAGAWELDLNPNSEFSHPNEGNVKDTVDNDNPELNELIDAIHQSGKLTKLIPEESNKIDDQNPNVEYGTTTTQSVNSNYQNESCHERYNFAADNKVVTTSGEEWTYGNYFYSHQEEGGLPVISIYTAYDNQKADCSGMNIDQTGETIYAFVDYKPDENKMYWCIDDEGKNCFMTFHKLLP